MSVLLETLQAHPGLFLGLSVVLGLIIGSFLNVVILRLPAKMEQEMAEACAELREEPPEAGSNRWFGLAFLISPASSCPACGHRIRAWENVPVLSYLLLKGRCSACGSRISRRYPVVEALTALLTLIVAWRFGATPQALAAMLLTWGLLAASVIDIDHQLLPDQLTLPLLWAGLLLNIEPAFAALSDAVIGAVAGYVSLWLVYHLFLLISGKEGMGYGDFKLFALLGAWLGWQLLPQILLVSAVAGAAIGIGMIVVRGRDRSLPIPFGPYLAIAGWVGLLWGAEINQAYLQAAGLG